MLITLKTTILLHFQASSLKLLYYQILFRFSFSGASGSVSSSGRQRASFFLSLSSSSFCRTPEGGEERPASSSSSSSSSTAAEENSVWQLTQGRKEGEERREEENNRFPKWLEGDAGKFVNHSNDKCTYNSGKSAHISSCGEPPILIVLGAKVLLILLQRQKSRSQRTSDCVDNRRGRFSKVKRTRTVVKLTTIQKVPFSTGAYGRAM